MGSHKAFLAYICFTITNFLAIFVATKDPGPRLDLGPANKSLVLFVGSRTNNLPELCSGVIVAPHYVLTSDKCVEGLDEVRIEIQLFTPDPPYWAHYRSEQIYHHLRYPGQSVWRQINGDEFKSELALIRFRYRFHESRVLQICDDSNIQSRSADGILSVHAKDCPGIGDPFIFADPWKNPVCVSGMLGKPMICISNMTCVAGLYNGEHHGCQNYDIGYLIGYQRVIKIVSIEDELKLESACSRNFKSVPGIGDEKCFKIIPKPQEGSYTSSHRAAWDYCKEHEALLWHPRNRTEMTLMYEYLVNKLGYDSDVKIWLGYMQILSNDALAESVTCIPGSWENGSEKQCSDKNGTKSDKMVTVNYTTSDVRLGFRKHRFSSLIPNDELWGDEVDQPYLKKTRCMVYQKKMGGAYVTPCESEDTMGICYYEKDKPRRFKNNWCEPGFEILPHVSNSTCFALERRYGLESAATVRKYCPEQSFSRVWEPWRSRDLEYMHWHFLELEQTTDADIQLGYIQRLSKESMRVGTIVDLKLGYRSYENRDIVMPPDLWGKNVPSREHRCVFYSKGKGVHSDSCDANDIRYRCVTCEYPACPEEFKRTAWSLKTNKCYRPLPLNKNVRRGYGNIYEAVNNCERLGANLLEVDGEDELSKLREAFPELKDSTLWIGVARQKVARQPNVQNSKFAKLSDGSEVVNSKNDNWFWLDVNRSLDHATWKCVSTWGESNALRAIDCYDNDEEPQAVCEITPEIEREPEEKVVLQYK